MTATATPANLTRRRGPDVVAYPMLRGRRFRLRGPASVDVARALGVPLLVTRPQLDDVAAWCESSSPRLLLVVARDRSNRRA